MIHCITIDDEPLALRQMEAYIEKTSFLQLDASFESAIDAANYLQDKEVDLMFVDINMPDLSGMDFVKSLTQRPEVIFTTAYSEYAIEGFKVDALDYLLKPISYSGFLKAASKANSIISLKQQKNSASTQGDNFLLIKSEYKIIRVNYADIRYVEGMREYLRFHLREGKAIMSLMSMKKLEEKLPADEFMRVHRSYIVRKDQIQTIERNRIVFEGSIYIPVSKQYQAAFQDFLRKNFLD
ncbi:MAG: LytTR family DNA-binding domain-containing protein [Bacteroidia bacterium]|nr:LytTR family DNA-binding domain-containing protein [Bacteroidia bacterium]